MLSSTNSLAAFGELQREMNRLFEGFGPRLDDGAFRALTFPALNMWEDDDSLFAEAEIPGVNEKDLEVYAVDNQLTIKGLRKPRFSDDVAYHRRERSAGQFIRVITLPVDIESDKVQAVLKNGVLTLTLRKAQHSKPRRISVKTN